MKDDCGIMDNTRCEIAEKPNRMYYKNDWRCDCKTHTQENYITILNNIFDVKNAHFFPFKTFDGKQDDSYIVNLREDCVLETLIRECEYHGLMLSSIHVSDNKKSRLSFHFKETGWF